MSDFLYDRSGTHGFCGDNGADGLYAADGSGARGGDGTSGTSADPLTVSTETSISLFSRGDFYI